jgi:uncharacterized membrane protein (UPF0127 family)
VRTAVLALILAGLLAVPPSDRVRAQSASAGAASGCGDPSAPYAEVQIDTFPRIDLELARTEAEREQGLMYVTDLPPDSGMLFVYTSPSREGYWMYHTEIPLSIAWIDHNGTILDIQDMPRLDDPNDAQAAAQQVYNPAVVPYWYALEVNEGWFVQHGVGVGQQMVFCLGS